MSDTHIDRVVTPDSPWHAGELMIQEAAGVAQKMDVVGRKVIRDYLVEQHRAFYPLLPSIVVGSVDPEGNAWATLLCGHPGFLQSPDQYTLRVKSSPNPIDPAILGLRNGDAAGLLGIALDTRRRNRVNGLISRIDGTTFDVTVERSFGNCPRYIHLRDFQFTRDPTIVIDESPAVSDRLDAGAKEMIRRAATFFVASYMDDEHGHRGVDVSHRGGKPGFVRVDDDGVLIIPDFAGNLHFATLGNILLNPRCGLVFCNFETGDLLQLSGDAELIVGSSGSPAIQGAERLWCFRTRKAMFRPGALPLCFIARDDGTSPTVLSTGTWEETASQPRAL
ncbi:pyridoxamine 5'-phosphate oxidase family protein [Paraburkholderia elongata]|uniref:Flavin-nucleotide-binding protein n=1 Tax=Paraburkholderia elongata TaxID=2675747 RepID=A0A972NMU9_9BURK|nr:pyridoxamine 5'-phosphate oxidase family protein [Paraburkholderia elongata]NPT54692.1 flavin-nucleotide-binding protein [Paraburkholderia elongata]